MLGLDRCHAGDGMSARTDLLRVYESPLPLIRLGRDNDGGYVLADVSSYDGFLSGGIADDNSFELAVLERYPKLVCDAYDPVAVGGLPTHERYRFHQGKVPHLAVHNAEALVKLDIEGDEWRWLHITQRLLMAQLVVELHSPHLERWDWEALWGLCETHVLIHAHGNNWDGIVEIDGVPIPGTLETTWLAKYFFGPVPQYSRQPIPGPLDQPNRPGVPDHVITWPPFVEQ